MAKVRPGFDSSPPENATFPLPGHAAARHRLVGHAVAVVVDEFAGLLQRARVDELVVVVAVRAALVAVLVAVFLGVDDARTGAKPEAASTANTGTMGAW